MRYFFRLIIKFCYFILHHIDQILVFSRVWQIFFFRFLPATERWISGNFLLDLMANFAIFSSDLLTIFTEWRYLLYCFLWPRNKFHGDFFWQLIIEFSYSFAADWRISQFHPATYWLDSLLCHPILTEKFNDFLRAIDEISNFFHATVSRIVWWLHVIDW